jgi:hypothetical protein
MKQVGWTYQTTMHLDELSITIPIFDQIILSVLNDSLNICGYQMQYLILAFNKVPKSIKTSIWRLLVN